MDARRLPLPTLLAALSLAAPAWAQDPTPTPPPPLPTPTPTPSPAPPPPQPTPAPAPPPPAKLSAELPSARGSAKRPLALRGARVRMAGVLSPAAPKRQRVIVRISRHGKMLRTRTVRTRANGRWRLKIRARWRGVVAIRAVHKASAEVGTARAATVRLTILRPWAASGSRGALVRMLQAELDRQRYAVSRSGVFDAATGRAIMAWRKVNGYPRNETADTRVVRAILRGRGAYRVRHPTHGHHVEADLSRQVMALVDGKRLVRVYTVSSGSPVTPTVIGTFRVYSKTPGVNIKQMVHSSYFIGGYAIHGYYSVPPFAASHGCLRVPIPNAWTIFNWIRYGDRVIVEP